MHSPCYFCLDFLCSSSLLIGFHCCLWYLYYCCYLCLSLPWFSFFQCVPVLFSLALIVFAHGSDSISLCLVQVGSSSAISAFITGLGRFSAISAILVFITRAARHHHHHHQGWSFPMNILDILVFITRAAAHCTVPLFPLFLTHLLEHIVVLPNSSTSGGNAECIVVR